MHMRLASIGHAILLHRRRGGIVPDRQRNIYGVQLQEARIRRALSINRLAKLSGVSRRHITSAEKGLNISIDVLKRLMRALGLTEITIDSGFTVRSANPLSSAEIEEVVSHLTKSAALTQVATERLRSFGARVGNSVPNDSPADEDVVAKAAALVGEFTSHVRALGDTKQLSTVKEGMKELFAEAARPATPARRRKRAS
jgi:predicted transcriptional regulator